MPTGFSNNGRLQSNSCNGQSCISAGRYQIASGTYYPLLAYSANAGTTWTYVIDQSTTLPTDFSVYGSFFSASCSGANCIAVGQYQDAGLTYYPLIAHSANGGATWTYVIDKSSTLPTDFLTGGSINGASCSGLNCTAVGNYNDPSFALYPLLAHSADGGATWTYLIDSSTPPSNFSAFGLFDSTSCNGQTCIAVGEYRTTASLGIYPLLANSTNGGTTWRYAIDDTSTLPTDFTAVPLGFGTPRLFSGASCDTQNCIASGTYNNGTDYYPLVAQNTNNGVTWRYPVDSASVLPTNFDSNGILYAALVGETQH